ncbi:MAG: 3-methyl-2-oxobutanoate hydroxymethyltransferase, partial [Treponema sp.]|nr:3-methyl-2-oxobutanoate hydroxymethyltransferase [Treponema sp.]
PQSINKYGTYTIRAKEEAEANKLINDALLLEKAGCFAIVAECIPSEVATAMSKAVSVPIIGIGGGAEVDGQVLVLHDMLGFSKFKPKFVRHFIEGAELVKKALNEYDEGCKNRTFPNAEEQFVK